MSLSHSTYYIIPAAVNDPLAARKQTIFTFNCRIDRKSQRSSNKSLYFIAPNSEMLFSFFVKTCRYVIVNAFKRQFKRDNASWCDLKSYISYRRRETMWLQRTLFNINKPIINLWAAKQNHGILLHKICHRSKSILYFTAVLQLTKIWGEGNSSSSSLG